MGTITRFIENKSIRRVHLETLEYPFSESFLKKNVLNAWHFLFSKISRENSK